MPMNTNTKEPSIKVDLFYGLITLGSSTLWTLVNGWLLYFYMPPDGEGQILVPVALYSTVVFLVQAINAVLSPAVGYLSDNCRSRWGRRLPFMFLSGVPLLVLFVLIWRPPVAAQSGWNLLYLGIIYMFYKAAYTFNQIPYTALLPELALTDQHRVRISAWTSGFMLLGTIASAAAGLLIDRFGYLAMAVTYAVLLLPVFYVPFFVLRERPGRQISAAERLDFRESFSVMFQNRAFVIMSVTGFFYWITTTFVQAAIPFIVTQVCQQSESATVYFYAPAVAAALVCYPVITWLVKRWGKWRVFSGSLLGSAVVLPTLALIGDWLPVPLLTQGIVWVVLQAVTLAGVMMLPPAFGAEITDEDERLTGQRREGSYYAVWGLMDQVINGLAAALLPLILLLGRSQSDPRGPLGVRMVGVIGGLLMFAGFLVFQRYPLRGKAAAEGEGTLSV
jgi:GPH family glycoside/pentoside/hexuronide:cation symporter